MDTYGTLKTEVADWLNREDLTLKLPGFVRLAETEIYRGLRCHDNEFLITYTKASTMLDGFGGSPSIAGAFLLLPSNFVELKLVKHNGKRLKQCSDQQMATRLDGKWDSSPKYFAITARKIEFSSPINSDPATWTDSESLVYVYYGTESLDSLPTWQIASNPVENPVVENITPLALTSSDDNTTRMLQRNPDIYLHGTLYYASLYLKNKTEIAQWGGLFKAALEDLRLESWNTMIGGSTQEVSSGEEI